jgi:hypothetical protein
MSSRLEEIQEKMPYVTLHIVKSIRACWLTWSLIVSLPCNTSFSYSFKLGIPTFACQTYQSLWNYKERIQKMCVFKTEKRILTCSLFISVKAGNEFVYCGTPLLAQTQEREIFLSLSHCCLWTPVDCRVGRK